MTTWTKQWTVEDVLRAKDKDKPKVYAEYVQQTVGIQWPTRQDMMILRHKIKEFFGKVDGADWGTLCRIAQWARSRKKRPPRMWMIVDYFREAWRDGALPELDPSNREDGPVEEEIARILDFETRPDWRDRLMGARGMEARKEVLRWWNEDKDERREKSFDSMRAELAASAASASTATSVQAASTAPSLTS